MSETNNTMVDQETVDQEIASPEAKPKKRRWRMTRRGFLIGAGATGATLALGVYFGTPFARLKIAEMVSEMDMPSSSGGDPLSWFEILPDSRVRLYVPKVEMGQGIHTALGQIGLEELGISTEDFEVMQSGTHTGPGPDMTGGSFSVSALYNPLRETAAMLNLMLRRAAVQELNQPVDKLILQARSVAVAADTAQQISLADLVAKTTEWEVPEVEELALKPQTEFEFIGQPFPRLDIPDKVTGEAVYGYDVRLPNMLYGAVARPPTIEGKMEDVTPMEAREMAGVQEIVLDNDTGFAGVVATSRAEARAAVNAMNVAWDPGRLWQQEELEAIVQVTENPNDGVTVQREGDVRQILETNTTVAAEYRSPFAVHATLEPQAAAADVQKDKAKIWACTQSPGQLRDAVAAAIDMEPEQVELMPTYLGGGFGRKLSIQSAIESARLSKAVGTPVHVGWDRTEAMRYGYFRPPTHHKLYGTVENGRILAMEHQQASGDVAFPFFPEIAATILGADFGAYRGGIIRYDDIPNRQTIAWRCKLPVKTGWWRGLGLLANTFAVESFMDELAHAAGADPVEFRLAHMADSHWAQRMSAVVTAAAEQAGWGKALPEGHAHGIACSTDVDTVVAQVAEISWDEATGQIQVHNVSAAMDCGMTINPDGAIAQVEGNIMWGIGSTLLEEMRIKDGQVDIRNFDGYPLLTMRGAPNIETVLLEAGDGKPRGVGEPPIGPTAAAIGNAFFTLTGTRIRELPMTPEKLQTAVV